MSDAVSARFELARRLAVDGAAVAARHFAVLDRLEIERKGPQDLVSNADREVETTLRDALADAFPDDAVVGEEYGARAGRSGYTWVIDPIDGTANFVRGLPCWATVLACMYDGATVIGAMHDPNVAETYAAARGRGATLNGTPLAVGTARTLAEGSVGVSFSHRSPPAQIAAAVAAIVNDGGMFFRNASGALMLAYVAAGRLIGYCEPHMNAWDCIAGLLMVDEAGGRTLAYDGERVLADGCRVVAGTPGVYPLLAAIGDDAFGRFG